MPSSASVAKVDACSIGVSGFWPRAIWSEPRVAALFAPLSLLLGLKLLYSPWPGYQLLPTLKPGPVMSLQAAIVAGTSAPAGAAGHGLTNAVCPTPKSLAMLITLLMPSRCARSSNAGSDEMAAATLTFSAPVFSPASANLYQYMLFE